MNKDKASTKADKRKKEDPQHSAITNEEKTMFTNPINLVSNGKVLCQQHHSPIHCSVPVITAEHWDASFSYCQPCAFVFFCKPQRKNLSTKLGVDVTPPAFTIFLTSNTVGSLCIALDLASKQWIVKAVVVRPGDSDLQHQKASVQGFSNNVS
ncbi:hypothetical protein VNO77_12424 [Canavalia gladiata]|uniref:Uncharacterized protein n=1 Tax=Canavalia gladiata TaxID=3824 RepID=A0AAN9LZW1_CANGL